MCFGTPKVPEVPKAEDPILPKQPLQQQQPAGLEVGRKDSAADSKLKQNRSRRKLRITKDTSSVQAPTSVGGASGVTVTK